MAKRKPASEMVIDQAPRADQSAPDPVERTEAAQKAIVPWATGGQLAIEFHPTMVEIARMKEEALALLEENVEDGVIKTTEGYEAIWKRYRELVPLRTAVDERRLEEGRQAREYVKMVNTAGNTIMEAIAAIEKPLKAAVDATDRKNEEEALARALAIEAEQRRSEDERLAAIKAEEEARKAEEQRQLQEQRDKIAAEQKRLDDERAEFIKKQEEQLAEQRRLAQAEVDRLAEERRKQEEAARLAREELEKDLAAMREERARMLKEKADAEEAERRRQQAIVDEENRKAAEAKRAEELELAKKKAAEEALAAAERKRIADELEAKAKKEREEAAAAEKAARAPDKQKARVLANLLGAMEIPEMKSKEGKDVVYQAGEDIKGVISLLNQFAEKK